MLLALAIALAIPSLTLALSKDRNRNGMDDANENNASSFSISSVSPHEVPNGANNPITITGSGFNSIASVRVQLGKFDDNPKDTTDNVTVLTNVVRVNDTTITAVVPAGTPSGMAVKGADDLTIIDEGANPAMHFTLEDAVEIKSSVRAEDNSVDFAFSSSNSTKSLFTVRLVGITLRKKGDLKARVDARRAEVRKIIRVGDDTIVTLRVKSGQLEIGNHVLTMDAKREFRKVTINKRGKEKIVKVKETEHLVENELVKVHP